MHGLHHDEEEHDHEEELDEHEEHDEHEEETRVSKYSHSTSSETFEEGDSSKLITALLVRSKGLSEQFLLLNELGNDSNIQAISPTATLRKLLNTLDIGSIIVRIVAYIAIILSIIIF